MAMKRQFPMAIFAALFALATVCGVARAQEVPLVTGEHWTKSSEEMKKWRSQAMPAADFDARALAAARIACRRLVRIACASGAAITTASICLQISDSPLAFLSSSRNGWTLLNVANISP